MWRGSSVRAVWSVHNARRDEPWLEHPALWPDVHNSLLAATRDALAPRVAPKYYVGLERRTYLLTTDELVLIGMTDVSVAGGGATRPPAPSPDAPSSAPAAVETIVPIADEVGESYLEIHDVAEGRLVTALELLSPANKLHAAGREQLLAKRSATFRTRTSWIEVDLLREGQPMPLGKRIPTSDYRILVSRGSTRPHAQLFCFDLRQPIPEIPVPLLPGDIDVSLDLGAILHETYERARFDLRLRYDRDPKPPLSPEDRSWASKLVPPARG